MWVTAFFKDVFALKSGHTPNHYFVGAIRGDIFEFILVDDAESTAIGLWQQVALPLALAQLLQAATPRQPAS